MRLLRRLLRNKDGATAIEYALVATLISIGIIATVQGIGDRLATTFHQSSSTLGVANAAASS